MTSRMGRRYFIYKFTDEELKTIEECCSDIEKQKNNYRATYFNRTDKTVNEKHFNLNEKYINKGAIWGAPNAKPDPYRESDIYSISNDSILESLLMEKAQLANKEAFWNVDINRIQKPQHSEYPEGGHYDWHTDQFLMPVNEEVRKISMTLFLNDPDEYEGGELLLRQGTEIREIKLPAGWAFTYPTGTEHKVNKIISGERRVAVWWTTSTLRNLEDRQLAVYNCQAKEELLKNHPTAENPGDIDYLTYRALEEQINSLMRFKGY